MNIAFLTDDEKQNAEINCPFKPNNNKSGTLAHGFYPGNSTLFEDLHFDNERWSDQKTVSGDGKYNLFSVAVCNGARPLHTRKSTKPKSSSPTESTQTQEIINAHGENAKEIQEGWLEGREGLRA